MLQPFNRHVLIVPEHVKKEKRKEQTTILLPDDYAKVEGRYCAATVLDWAPDCRLQTIEKGGQILVDRSMIEEVEYGGSKHYLILDNYIIAKIKENIE
jgi:co-chaperonin GroES (HSP10)